MPWHVVSTRLPLEMRLVWALLAARVALAWLSTSINPYRVSRQPYKSLGHLHQHPNDQENSLHQHHAALQTRNITLAMDFYSLIGYQVECRFRAGPARAAWLRLGGSMARLELLEVPPYLLEEPPGQQRRALDRLAHPAVLGYHHVAVEVSELLQDYLCHLNATSVQRFGRSLRVAVEPRQQIIGCDVYELAFLYDADGCLVELLHKQGSVASEHMASGWEPWNGTGFVGGQGDGALDE